MQNMYSDMMKMWTQMKTPMPMQMGMPPVPSVNMDDIVAIGKRNMEACSEAAACVTEGIQTIARRQAQRGGLGQNVLHLLLIVIVVDRLEARNHVVAALLVFLGRNPVDHDRLI